MQILITHGALARSKVLQINRAQLLLALAGLVVVLMLLSGTIYHMIFLKAARDGWPVVSQIVRFVVRDEIAQRDRFMRENLDAMAVKVGEMQAKLVKLEAMGERVSGLAGVKADGLKAPLKTTAPSPRGAPGTQGGQGGPFVPMRTPSLEQLQHMVSTLDEVADQDTDLLTYFESRLLERRMQSLMVPNSRPVDVDVGSGFGFRTDPFTGRPALHTGLDFPAEIGTPIHAAAGGVVQTVEWHPAYGRMVEIDHGNGLVTRYAHTSKVFVKVGDLVKRGQIVAAIGTTGRSTGPHLHFEVLVEGVPQDPDKFLAGGPGGATERLAAGSPAKVTRRRR
jgi:murein DD-endopeptidase MepM/ murein hydrolase activator NlpD